MSALTKPFDIGIKDGYEARLKMAAEKIYQGSVVGVIIGTGYATKSLTTAAWRFMGVAEETVDNSAGSAGDKRIRIRRKGLCSFDSSGLTVASVGAQVYFSDDHTVTTSASYLFAGILVDIDENSKAIVDITGAVQANLFFCSDDNTVRAGGTALKSSALS